MATGTPLDIFHELRIDHDNIRDLYARFQTSSDDEQQKLAIANTLVREIVVHLEASELTLYKVLKQKGLMREVLEEDQKTHARITTLVATVDAARTLHPSSYDSLVNEAVAAFLEHAKEEEKVRLPQLELMITQEENDKLTLDFLKTRSTVPIHPHAHAPHTGGSVEKVALAAGKARDVVAEGMGRKREYVELKEQHVGVKW